MVHRRLMALTTLLVAMNSYGGSPVMEIDRDRIREEAVRDVLRWVPETSIEPDLATVRALFHRPIRLDEVQYRSSNDLAQLQLLAHRYAISAEDALGLVAKTMGYEIVRNGVGELKSAFLPPDGEVSVKTLLERIEDAGNVRISVYPESALLVLRRPQ